MAPLQNIWHVAILCMALPLVLGLGVACNSVSTLDGCERVEIGPKLGACDAPHEEQLSQLEFLLLWNAAIGQ